MTAAMRWSGSVSGRRGIPILPRKTPFSCWTCRQGGQSQLVWLTTLHSSLSATSFSSFGISPQRWQSTTATYDAERLRNIAIIAHVDHGKTTLVDQLLQQSGTMALAGSDQTTRVMDSNTLEKERGITILSKCTSINHKGHRINIVDTPGHADFGGEVERILSMVDGVALVVDATEGPMTQTRFVLSKALQRGLKPLVVMNKADRATSRTDQVDSDIMDLFCALEATDAQMDYPMLYASAKEGWATATLADTASRKNMQPLFDLILSNVPAPTVDRIRPFSMLVTQIEADPYVGKCLLGKITSGYAKVGARIKALDAEGKIIDEGRITKILSRIGLEKLPVDEAGAGDIISIAGLQKAGVNATLCDHAIDAPIPSVPLDPPTISMFVSPNDSPLSGTEGTQITSNLLKNRLDQEAQTNISLHVLHSKEQPELIEMRGRGVLHLGIVIETLRREGFEMSVFPPTAVFKRDSATKKVLEPIESVLVDVREADAGTVIEKLTKRKADIKNYTPVAGDRVRIELEIPARGLLGYVAGEFKNDTHGEGILNHIFLAYEPYKGEIETTRKGSLISMAKGECSAYALQPIEARGALFVRPGDKVYAGMIVGENAKDEDLAVNPVKTKVLTNMRAAGKDDDVRLSPAQTMTLEEIMAYVQDDEVIEVTPKGVRLRKRELDAEKRKANSKRKKIPDLLV